MTNEDLISDLRKSLDSSELNQLQMLSSHSKSLKQLREDTVKSEVSRNSHASKKSVTSPRNPPQASQDDSPLKKLRSSKLKPVNLLEAVSDKIIKTALDAPRLPLPNSADSKRCSEDTFS